MIKKTMTKHQPVRFVIVGIVLTFGILFSAAFTRATILGINEAKWNYSIKANSDNVYKEESTSIWFLDVDIPSYGEKKVTAISSEGSAVGYSEYNVSTDSFEVKAGGSDWGHHYGYYEAYSKLIITSEIFTNTTNLYLSFNSFKQVDGHVFSGDEDILNLYPFTYVYLTDIETKSIIHTGFDSMDGIWDFLDPQKYYQLETEILASACTLSGWSNWSRVEASITNFNASIDGVIVDPVPEPTTAILLFSGLIGLVGIKKKFKA